MRYHHRSIMPQLSSVLRGLTTVADAGWTPAGPTRQCRECTEPEPEPRAWPSRPRLPPSALASQQQEPHAKQAASEARLEQRSSLVDPLPVTRPPRRNTRTRESLASSQTPGRAWSWTASLSPLSLSLSLSLCTLTKTPLVRPCQLTALPCQSTAAHCSRLPWPYDSVTHALNRLAAPRTSGSGEAGCVGPLPSGAGCGRAGAV